MWDTIAQRIAAATGQPFAIQSKSSIGGGCINAAYCIAGGGRRYFVKTNAAAKLDMFEAEAEGLHEIIAGKTLRAPRPVATGSAGGTAWLALEYLDIGRGSAAGEARLGQQLAAMHRITQPRFGWKRDNTIGATPQQNAQTENWIDFFRERRLLFQLDLAARRGHGALQKKGELLAARLEDFFAGYAPLPSLLHGDLWGGNCGFAANDPVVFDPAVYYGDREADLAMTELFGGFSPRFYAAYREAWPLDPGYAVRKELYNLYHILNHANLFGGGYARQAQATIERLLAEAGYT